MFGWRRRAKLTMTSVTRSIADHDQQRRTDTIMGYYDNEPQTGETGSTTDLPTDTLNGGDAGSFEDDEVGGDSKDKKYY